MPNSSEEETHIVELKVTQILTDETILLYKAEDESYKAVMELLAHGKGETLVRLYDAMCADLREALQFALQELQEAEDKLWVSHCNHPGDAGIENKDSLFAEHRRQDKSRLEGWSKRAGDAANEIRCVLAK